MICSIDWACCSRCSFSSGICCDCSVCESFFFIFRIARQFDALLQNCVLLQLQETFVRWNVLIDSLPLGRAPEHLLSKFII